jgi:hypothetical protein
MFLIIAAASSLVPHTKTLQYPPTGDFSHTRGCGRFRFLIMDSEWETFETQYLVLGARYSVWIDFLVMSFVC